MVLRMGLEMLSQIRYSVGHNCYLHLGGTSILLMHLIITNNAFFSYFVKCHAITAFPYIVF